MEKIFPKLVSEAGFFRLKPNGEFLCRVVIVIIFITLTFWIINPKMQAFLSIITNLKWSLIGTGTYIILWLFFSLLFAFLWIGTISITMNNFHAIIDLTFSSILILILGLAIVVWHNLDFTVGRICIIIVTSLLGFITFILFKRSKPLSFISLLLTIWLFYNTAWLFNITKKIPDPW